MPPALECRDVRKRYASSAAFSVGCAERGVDLTVAKGELFAVIGPSGCGKSTLLRIIGGFVDASSGSVVIDGRDVTAVPPHSRPTNMVFQNYALFPHMTIGNNVGFGLEMEGVERSARRRRVAEALELVGLAGFRDRYVGELSGGQMQRTALARALVKRPAILLLDEPLGALDLQLRRQMQEEIVRLKIALGTTILHVTHDQEEACAIADKIAVLRDGVVLQIDDPPALYQNPATTFVAEFINAGTVVRGAPTSDGSTSALANAAMSLAGATSLKIGEGSIAALLPRHGAKVRRAAANEPGRVNELRASVVRMSFTGIDFSLHLQSPAGLSVSLHLPIEEVGAAGLRPGIEVVASWRSDQVRFLRDDSPAAVRQAAAA